MSIWINNVGSMRSTMHWSAESLYFHLHSMGSKDSDEFQKEFNIGSVLDAATNGVMDVMFTAACYSPVMARLGDAFWPLARELIRLRVGSTDQLNLLLWFGVIPQTVLVLEPKRYYLDSMIPHVKTNISIEGSIGLDSNECDSWEQEYCARTLLEVPGNTSLVFLCNVRISTIFVQRREVSSVYSSNRSVLRFHGSQAKDSSLVLDRVMLVGSGCYATGFEKVHCNQLSVVDASVGFIGKNINTLSLTGGVSDVGGGTVKSGFIFCDEALRLSDVGSFYCSGQCFEDARMIFRIRIRQTCVVENCVLVRSDHMGEIMASPGCSPSFLRLQVISLVSSLSLRRFLTCWFDQIDPSISAFLEGGDPVIGEDQVVYLSTAPRYLSCSSVPPEEI